MDSQRWWCLLSKNYSILNLGEFFHSEKYRVFTQYAAATILRHWATMSWITKASNSSIAAQLHATSSMLGFKTFVIPPHDIVIDLFAQIAQYTSPISHHSPFCNENMHMYAHLCYKLVHCGIFVCCIVGFWDGCIAPAVLPYAFDIRCTRMRKVSYKECRWNNIKWDICNIRDTKRPGSQLH